MVTAPWSYLDCNLASSTKTGGCAVCLFTASMHRPEMHRQHAQTSNALKACTDQQCTDSMHIPAMHRPAMHRPAKHRQHAQTSNATKNRPWEINFATELSVLTAQHSKQPILAHSTEFLMCS
jgi:hypothetical protein